MYRTLAHAPAVLDAVSDVGAATRCDLDPKLRELAYPKTTRLTDCHDRRHDHLAPGRRAGLSGRQVHDRDGFEAGEAYTPLGKDVLRLAEPWTDRGRVGGDVLVRLVAARPPDHVVLVAGTVGQASVNHTCRISRVPIPFGPETAPDIHELPAGHESADARR